MFGDDKQRRLFWAGDGVRLRNESDDMLAALALQPFKRINDHLEMLAPNARCVIMYM